jgi:DNA-directed RNA polymerase I and III subunit RPAC2
MADSTEGYQGGTVNDIKTSKAVTLFEVLGGGDEFSKTYVFGNEDHTLGNALRHILANRDDVDFCGYSVPHPYEPKMNLRLQTRGVPADQILMAALKSMGEMCDNLDAEWEKSIKIFNN